MCNNVGMELQILQLHAISPDVWEYVLHLVYM